MSSLFLLMTTIAVTSMAQVVPNGSFADWERKVRPESIGAGTYLNPTGGWGSSNILVDSTVIRVEGRTTGSTAARLTSKLLNCEGASTITALLSTSDYESVMTGGRPKEGIPIAEKPNNMTFWYKYIPVAGDQARVFVKLWRRDGTIKKQWRKSVSFTSIVSDWTKCTIDFRLPDENNEFLDFIPDSVVIEFTSSLSGLSYYSEEGTGAVQPGSEFYVTEVAFGVNDNDHVYTICGTSDFIGWDPSDRNNDMSLVSDGVYRLVKRNVFLTTSMGYCFYVAQDHDVLVTWGVGGQNVSPDSIMFYSFNVAEDTYYDVTFDFRPSDGVCTVDYVKVSTPTPETQIPNGNFAEWENREIPSDLGGGTYARPSGGWDCLNSLVSGSVTMVEGRTVGSTAALLTSKKIVVEDVGTLYTSSLALTDFLTAYTEGSPMWGIPFNNVPQKFTFWYKYEPVNGDKGRVYLSFWQGDYHNATYKWRKKVTLTETVSDWVKVEVDLTDVDMYGKNLDFSPDYLLIEITSTISGISPGIEEGEESEVEVEGSKLWITELQFSDELSDVKSIATDLDNALEVYDLFGRKLTAPSKGINIVKMSNGQVKKVVIK